MLKVLRLAIPLIVGIFLVPLVALVPADRASGFRSAMGGVEDCSMCHTLTVAEATPIIQSMNPTIDVVSVAMSPVEGVWEVVIEARGKKGIAYIDFSKEHIITGSVLKVSTKENLTQLRLYDLSKVDFSTIPLDGALAMGNPDAKYKVIVFDDPD